MMRLLALLLLLVSVCTDAAADISVPAKYACQSENTIRAILDPYFNDGKFEYAVVKLDGGNLLARLVSNRNLSIPLVTRNAKVRAWEGKGKPFVMRAPGMSTAQVYDSVTEVRDVSLGSAMSYKFECVAKNAEADPDWRCGQFNFLNSTGSQYEGVFASKEFGTTVIESAESLILNMRQSPISLPDKCAVVYNTATIPPFDIDGTFGEGTTSSNAAPIGIAAVLERTYRIHLDGTSQFLHLDEDNWWLRMESIIGGANFTYMLLEPLTGKKFKIWLRPATLSVWNTGFGPSETNPRLLIDFINDPSYRREFSQADNELFYFFVGYDLDGGTAGIAGSICNVRRPGMGDHATFQRTRALSQQIPDADGGYQFGTYWGRIVVATHEIGHLLGGRHDHASNNQCAGGALPRLCGSTVMKSGEAGGVDPDFRKSFFSRQNDRNVQACIRHVDAF